MLDWNVVVTTQKHGFVQAGEFLKRFGQVEPTEFFNVLAMKVRDVGEFLETMRDEEATLPEAFQAIARIVPVTDTFGFQVPDEFEIKAREHVIVWVPILFQRSFHVRMHRRGFHGRMSSEEEEQFLDHFLMKCLDEQEASGRIDFTDPDYIITVETLGQRAGLSLWSREERQRYPFLKLD